MTAAVLDPLAYVLARARQVLGPGAAAEDCALAVVTRFLTGGVPPWLQDRPDADRLDVLTVVDVLGRRRAA